MGVFCLEFKQIDELKELTDQEFMNYVIWLKDNTPEMTVQFLEGEQNISQDEYEYELDDILKYLKYDVTKHIMICPKVDERESDLFQKIIFSEKDKKDRFPSTKFLNLVDATIQNELYGIATFVVGYYKITRKFSDYRFINKNRIEERKEIYLYSYENKRFEQIELKDKTPNVEEYHKRMKVVKYIKKRLKQFDFAYLEAFDRQLSYKRENNSKEAFLLYLQTLYSFLQEPFQQGMLVKKLFFNITTDEYNALLKYNESLLVIIESLQEELHQLEDGYEIKQNEMEHFTQVNKFFKPAAEKSNASKFGYFLLEKDETEYPNLGQIEKRNYLTDNPMNELQEVFTEGELDKMKEEIERIFTKEELEKIYALLEANVDKSTFRIEFKNITDSKKLASDKRTAYHDYFTGEERE